MFLVPDCADAADGADADAQLQALESVIKNGNRKKFACISKNEIIQTVRFARVRGSTMLIACASFQAQEDAKNARNTSGGGGKKSKQGSTPIVFKPQHIQV